MTPLEIHVILQFLSALMVHPANAATPHQPPVIDVHKSLADTADAVIRCYHPTGRLQLVNIIQTPWSQQAAWNGDASAVLRIQWRGTINEYTSTVALVERGEQVHAVLLQDGAIFPANKRCALDGWVAEK